MHLIIGLMAAVTLTGQTANPTGDYRAVAFQSDGMMSVDITRYTREGDIARAPVAIYLQPVRGPQVVAVSAIRVNCANERLQSDAGEYYSTDMELLDSRPAEDEWYEIETPVDRKIVDFMCGSAQERQSSGREAHPDVRSGFPIFARSQ